MSTMNSTSSNEKLWKICPLYKSDHIMVVSLPSEKYYISFVTSLICNILLIILAVTLNLTTILAYWRSARLKNKTSYFLVMLLSVIDLTAAAIGHPIFVVSLALTINGNPNCTIHILHEILTFFTVTMSFATLFALNVERYLCIVYPFFHRTKMTKLRLLSLTAYCWLVGFVVALFHVILGRVSRSITSVAISLKIVLTVYIYASICLAARRTARNPPHANENELKKLQNLKMAKSCAMVVACTAICYLPYAVMSCLERNIFVTMFMEVWSKTFALISSSLNSLVFFWRNPILRKEAKAVLKNPTLKICQS